MKIDVKRNLFDCRYNTNGVTKQVDDSYDYRADQRIRDGTTLTTLTPILYRHHHARVCSHHQFLDNNESTGYVFLTHRSPSVLIKSRVNSSMWSTMDSLILETLKAHCSNR